MTTVIDYDLLGQSLKSVVSDELESMVAAQVEAALKQFEDSAKVRGAGLVTPDGGTADAEMKSMADFLTAIARGDAKRLTQIYGSSQIDDRGEKKALNEQTGGAGGWTVPPEFNNRLLEQAGETSLIDRLPAGRRPMEMPMSSRTLEMPMLDQSIAPAEGASAADAGVVAYWTAEAGSITETEPKFKRLQLEAHKLAGYTVASQELNSDSAQALESLLTRLFGRAIGNRRSYAFMRGDGVGKPLGVRNAPAAIAVTRAGGGNVVDKADILGMLEKQINPDNAVWLAHPFLRSTLADLQIGTNTAMAWGDIRNGYPATLMGVPILFGQHMSAPGSAFDLALIDWSYYLIGNRGGTAIAMSPHAKFLTDELTWRFTHRVDGQPWVSNKMMLADGAGSNYVSPFIYLS
jgi:HK97 family phage major capsid protein